GEEGRRWAVVVWRGARLTRPRIPGEPWPPQSHRNEPETLKGVQRAYIARVLEETDWVIAGPRGAAARLGLKRTTLQALLRRLGLSRPRDDGGAELDGQKGSAGAWAWAAGRSRGAGRTCATPGPTR